MYKTIGYLYVYKLITKDMITMKTMTSTEARQNFSSVIATVKNEPITIVKQEKKVAVVVSSDRYEELSKMEDKLYGKMAELSIKEGFALNNEARDLLNSI